MEVKVKHGIFMLFLQVSCAVWQRVTVREGQTVTLDCAFTKATKRHVEWKNPDGYIMFFDHNRALKDKRYSISEQSKSRFAIRISNVSFKDGGDYTCTHYGRRIKEKKVELTVLPGSTTTKTQTVWNTTSITEQKILNAVKSNSTKGNTTVGCRDQHMQTQMREISPLLVFLVMSLILALLAVVLFFLLKLQRAHAMWRKENQNCDPSEESGRSRSVQEEGQ